VSDDDPFEELDEAVEDREGDPFDSLGPPEDGAVDPEQEEAGIEEDDPSDIGAGETDADAERSPWGEPLDPDTPDDVEPAGEKQGGSIDDAAEQSVDRSVEDEPREGPTVEGPPGREGDPFEAMGDAFTEMEVEGVDPDDVWERLASAEAGGAVTPEAERTYAEVSKHSYCEQCEFFSEPPEVDCSHEGTEIVEFLDMERVRVVDCPVVAERKDLEGE